MSTRVKDLPIYERPREKAFRYGIDSLSDIELLALFIGSGSKDFSAIDIAYQILSDNGGLKGLTKLGVLDYQKYKGLNKVKSLTLASLGELNKRINIKNCEVIDTQVISNEYLYNKYVSMFSNTNREHLVVIMFNHKKQIIHEKTLYIGSENNVPFSYKDLFRELIINRSKYFYLIHNHPNGSSLPSDEDLILTSEITREAKKVGFILLDHLIISEEGYYSFIDDCYYNR